MTPFEKQLCESVAPACRKETPARVLGALRTLRNAVGAEIRRACL
jgi:hypothetical protein